MRSSSDRPLASLILGLAAGACAACAGPAAAQGLEEKVNAAIQRGRAALLPRLASQLRNIPADYPMGRIALSLAAVLKAGILSEDETVVGALARLEELPVAQTYSAACYLFALDAYWQARHREGLAAARKAKAGSTSAAAVPRVPPEGPVRKAMERCIAWLVQGSGGTWSYGGRGPGDLSNSQFAVLGLEIGLENGIPIPLEVFRAVAEHLVRVHHAEGEPEPFALTVRTPAWEGVTAGVARTVTLTVVQGGWNYEMNPGAGPSHTMTAAGVSSLLIARRALRDQGVYSGELAAQVDRQIHAGFAWMGRRVSGYLTSQHYGIYSLEKAGDIGGILLLGTADWYQEGARFLLRSQRRDGSWGDEVNTAFALLFLTRATRSHLQALGPPVHLTGGGAGNAGNGDDAGDPDGEGSDLVHVARLQGFVSAATVFEFLADTRDPALVPVAEEVVRGYPPHRMHEVVLRLLSVWTGEADAVTRFARAALERISGLAKAERPAFEVLAGGLAKARELERKGEDPAGELPGLLRGARSALLKRRALDLIDRLGQAEAFPAVIEELAGPDPEVRRRAREVLEQWAGGGAPAEGSREDPEAWRAWWAARGADVAARRRALSLLDRIERGGDAKEVDAAVDALARLGEAAVPPILAAMERGEYSAHLLRALAAVTGESAGLRAEDWKRALAGRETAARPR